MATPLSLVLNTQRPCEVEELLTQRSSFIEKLGQHPDRGVAEIFSVSPLHVSQTRKSLGIASFRQSRANRAQIDRDKLASVQHMFGTATDAQIALQTGVSRLFVQRYRTAAGIKAFNKANTTPEQLPVKAHRYLGFAPDRIIAERFDCKKATVSKVRIQANIKPYSRRAPRDVDHLIAWLWLHQMDLQALAAALEVLPAEISAHMKKSILPNWLSLACLGLERS